MPPVIDVLPPESTMTCGEKTRSSFGDSTRRASVTRAATATAAAMAGAAQATMTTIKRIPLPGGRVRGSASGRPVMALLDLLGRRWALRILFELRDGAQNFRALQASVEAISPSICRPP